MGLTKAAVLTAILLLVGCATAGNSSLRNETVDSIGEILAVGQTVDQVRAVLGDPMVNSRSSDGLRTWIYSLTEAQYDATTFIPVVGLFDSGLTGAIKTLTISFDENDLVAEFTMSETDLDIDTSILN